LAVSDDYLWDRSGSDAEVESLETLLRPMALKAQEPPRAKALSVPRLAWAAVAAAILVALVNGVVRPDPPPPAPAMLDFGDVGQVTVEPNTRVRVLRRTEELIKLRLERGTIHASISADARPRLFQVETPSTTCVDLGCHYTLSVDEAGRAIVRVTTGRVAFVDGDREVYVPRDASCRAAPRRGSGTPVFDDAAPEFVESVLAFDAAPDAGRPTAARAVIASARPRDSLTLWHFLQDPDPAIARLALEAIEKISPESGIARDATLRRDGEALAAWKEHLEWQFWR
jgi:hypothetical protein